MTRANSGEVKVGQIWREVDPRKERYVRVVELCPYKGGVDVHLETVEFDGTLFTRCRGTRLTFADSIRFKGKRGGYELHMEAR